MSIQGTRGKITIQIGEGSELAVADLLSWSIDEKGDTIEDTAMNPALAAGVPLSRTYIPGLVGWTGKLTANYKPSDAAQIAMKVGYVATFKGYPDSDASGKTYVTGSVLFTGRSRSGAVAGKVEFSGDFQGTGDLSESTVG